ncbi:MAG: AzlD family protein [Chloroflexota bacterium]
MDLDVATALTIAGMALVTYGTRIAGVLVMSRVDLSARTQAWLAGIPGAVLVSIVAPAVVTKGFSEAPAALLTALVAIKTRNMLLSVAAGVFAVWVLRQVV